MAVIGDSKLRKAILLGIALAMLLLGPLLDSNGSARGASPTPPVPTPPVQPPPIPSAPPPPAAVPDLPAPPEVPPIPPQTPPIPPTSPPKLPQTAVADGASSSPARSGGGAPPSTPGETSRAPSEPIAGGGASPPPPQPHSTIEPRSRPAPVADSRIAPIRGWLIRLWPAVALGPTALATVFDALESEASSFAADIAASFRKGVAGVGAASPSASAAKNPQAISSDSPSPPRAWLLSDPSLPIAVFWVVIAAAAALLTLMVRRELGLPAHKRRWRV